VADENGICHAMPLPEVAEGKKHERRKHMPKNIFIWHVWLSS
jgi:hypothetical protein